MHALSFTFLLFISLSTVETRRDSFKDYDEEILPVHTGGTTPGYTEDRTYNGYNQGRDDHEILPSYLSGTTPGYTEDRTHNGYNQGRDDHEILPSYLSGTTPGYTEDRTYNGYNQGRDDHEILPSYFSGTTPGYTEDRTYNGYNQGRNGNEIPPTYPSGTTPGYVPKGGLKGNNGWHGYGGRGYGQRRNRPLTRPSVSLPAFSGFGGSGFTRGMTRTGGGHFDEIDRLMKKTLGMMLDDLSHFRRRFREW
ncbi:hypothetical protein V3C99_013455 [Haemonchus contortus]